MITAEIKINGKFIADIKAINVGIVSDCPGDFIGDRATVCRYECEVSTNSGVVAIDVEHDSRFGWQGLINKITKEITPTVIETVTVEGDHVKDNVGI